MSTMETIIIIVAIVSFAKVARARLLADTRGDRGVQPPAFADPFAHPAGDDLRRENEALRRDLAALAERVKVLERIVTDNRHSGDLAAEIESLRDR